MLIKFVLILRVMLIKFVPSYLRVIKFVLIFDEIKFVLIFEFE